MAQAGHVQLHGKASTELPMSMYTHLLGAARGQRGQRRRGHGDDLALAEAKRCRSELKAGLPVGLDPDAVPVVLALEIGYDVALIELAEELGVPTDPSRFEQPERERERLEEEFAALGIDLDGGVDPEYAG
jgi:hypothetical protein